MIFSRKSYPELISLHIPKTAGTSFRTVLKSVYGEDQVAMFNIEVNGMIRMNDRSYQEKDLPKVRVIHGHFVYDSLRKKFELPEDHKLITWVRDPVKRVISNFYYLESRIIELLDEQRNNLDILSKLQRTLIEFARAEINRNRQVKFLSGSHLEDYDFVGISEFFDQEVSRLSAVLKWKGVPEIPHHNKTPERATHLSNEIVEEIQALNAEDTQLYNSALQIRKDLMNA